MAVEDYCIISEEYDLTIQWQKMNIDKVYMYEEMMTNDDNVESSVLTSSLLKISCLYKFCYKLHISSLRSRWTELYSSRIYEEVVN